jgi:6-phosphogluconolactonase
MKLMWIRCGWITPAALVCCFTDGTTSIAASAATVPETVWVYVGTYTGGRSKGIYRFALDTQTGAPHSLGLAAEIVSPSFLALHPSQPFLYAVNEMGTFQGKPSGAVSAFSIERETGELQLLNQAAAGGSGPCHLVVDLRGRHVLVANYGSGSVAVLPIREDGHLQEAVSVVQHEGASQHPQRQTAPHAHGMYLDQAQRYALVPDLGLDKVLVYRFDESAGTLSAQDPPGIALPPGAGPRHLAFHPNGRWVYVINELNCTISPFRYRAPLGTLEALPAVSTLPDGVSLQPRFTTAEVAVHPSGKFLYGSNRGHDSIVVFSIDPTSGLLTWLQHEATQGKTPRHFQIDPGGKFLLAANQDSDSVVVFRINLETGNLTPAGHTLEVPAPVCITFFQP